jgi:hypothetical protein
MNGIHVDLPKRNEVVPERLADCLLGGAPRDEALSSPSLESLSRLKSTVLSRDVVSYCAVLCCTELCCAVLRCAVR